MDKTVKRKYTALVHGNIPHDYGTIVLPCTKAVYLRFTVLSISCSTRPRCAISFLATISHRIDKDTSGLLMVAKNDIAHRGLVEQLMDKTVKRKYTAYIKMSHCFFSIINNIHRLTVFFVSAYWSINCSIIIDAPIGRNKKDRQSMDVVDDGKEAVTHFNVIEHIYFI
jgi:23S rRNA-/tRNA-specific pseudouridylate synthase